MSDCCKPPPEPEHHCCHEPEAQKRSFDWILWIPLALLTLGLLSPLLSVSFSPLAKFLDAEQQLIAQMWPGMVLGVLSVGLMNLIPSKMILATLGRGRDFSSLLRATFAGLLLDLCNHGLLLIASRLYKSGVSYSQVLAFLIASPWNSLSLTIIMFALIGWKWALVIILLSLLVALLTGLVVQGMERSGMVSENPFQQEAEHSLPFKQHFHKVKTERGLLKAVFVDGIKDSKMVMRWLLLGMVLASLIQAFVSNEVFLEWFGASNKGLAMTLLMATILEVCSEGLLPIAADLLTRAKAPGNAFAFLMAGVSTDYTEILTLKETTQSLKLALLLPLISLPQIVVLAAILNQLQ